MDFSYSSLQSRPSSSTSIPIHRTQLHPRLLSSPPPLRPHRSSKSIIFLASFLTFPFLFYLFSTASRIHSSAKFTSSKPQSYHLLIHSSPSSSSVLHIFQFLNEGLVPFVNLDNGSDLNSFKVDHFGYSYSDDEFDGLVGKLVEFGKGRVPASEWGNSKVEVLINEEEFTRLSEEEIGVILGSFKRVLRPSGFLFRDDYLRIIQAKENGIYAWVAVNYVLGTLGANPLQTTGVVELGRASMQVVFAPKEQPPEKFLRTIKLGGITHSLYSQSFPQFGQEPIIRVINSGDITTWSIESFCPSCVVTDVALESLDRLPGTKLSSDSTSSAKFLGNPCISRGFELPINASDVKPSLLGPFGNFSACRSAAWKSLKRHPEKCLDPPCKIASSAFVEIGGNVVPPENFYYTSELFGILPQASLSDMEMAGLHYCEDDWGKIEHGRHGSVQLEVSRRCFFSAFAVALLHDTFGIQKNDIRIGFAHRSLSSIPIDWTLGAFILQAMLDPLETKSEPFEQVVGNDWVSFFLLFAVLLLIALAALFLLRLRKPQLKTIYDLEKGRYIVTRVPR